MMPFSSSSSSNAFTSSAARAEAEKIVSPASKATQLATRRNAFDFIKTPKYAHHFKISFIYFDSQKKRLYKPKKQNVQKHTLKQNLLVFILNVNPVMISG
jgi:hypothetical protein